MQRKYIDNGKKTRFCKLTDSVKEIREDVRCRLENEVWDEEKRFENPHLHYLDMSPALYKLKCELLNEHGNKMIK